MSTQMNLELIHHKVASGSVVDQRFSDGYVNATAMCQAAGKKWSHYWENTTTQAFLTELGSDAGIPASVLVQSIKGGVIQGTWVHPQVAIHLAQWLSPKFAVQVSKWVFDWMSGKGALAVKPSGLPAFLARYVANAPSIPDGYFSILQECTTGLVGQLHAVGWDIPDGWVPDISLGRHFCKHLRDNHGVDTDSFATYMHIYPGGSRMAAKLYPNDHLVEYKKWFGSVWMVQHAPVYFKKKDPASLAYLSKHPSLALPAPIKHAKLPWHK